MFKLVVCLSLLASVAGSKPQLAPIKVPSEPVKSESALCDPCFQLGGQALNILINYILNAGVIGGCGQLCSHLNSTAAQNACDLVCGVVGIKTFIKALDNTDLDPMYFCEILNLCRAGPDDAHIDLLSVQIDPTSIAKKDVEPEAGGATVQATLTVNVTKATGVGEWSAGVHGPVTGTQGPVGGSFFLADGLKLGVQNLGVKLTVQDTMPDPSDPQAPFPVTWMPGSYEFRFHVCQGECGSKHAHSLDFGHKSSNFTITESGNVVV
jgi:hypothetical protein